MKTLDDAVIELSGVWPEGAEVLLTTGDEWSGDVEISGRIIAGDKPYNDYGYAFMDQSIQGYAIIDSSAWIVLCRMNEFQQRAKELGFINGYRWGVEYKTDGKRPNLPDDVIVQFHHLTLGEKPAGILHFPSLHWWKITDERYKPADTSYLEKPALEPVPEEENWYDYDNQQALRLPPAGEKVQLKHKRAEQGIAELISYRDGEVVWWNVDGGRFQHDKARHYEFKPLDYDRKAKAERKKVVDAAYGVVGSKGWLEMLYDNGFLKLPE